MNLNQLRFVMAVANARTFTAAAERCYVTQSTLSSGIAQLERELGERLFVRTTRSVALTPFGLRLLPLVEDVLTAQDRLIAAADDYRDPDVKHVRIGICPLLDMARIERVLASYRDANRTTEIVFEQLSGVDPRAALEQRRFDFLLGPSEVKRSGIERAFLYDDELVYLASGRDSGCEPGPPVRLQHIADDTFLLVHERCGLTIRTRQLFRARRLKLKQYRTQAVSYTVLEEWARLGVGSAILPRSKVFSPSLGQPIVLANGQPVTVRFEAAWLGADVLAPHLQALAHHLNRAAAGIGGNSTK